MPTEITKQTYDIYAKRVKDFHEEQKRRAAELELVPDVLANALAQQMGAPATAIKVFGSQGDDKVLHQNTYFVDIRKGELPFAVTVSFGEKHFDITLSMLAIHRGTSVQLVYNSEVLNVDGPVNVQNANYYNVAASIAQIMLTRLELSLYPK